MSSGAIALHVSRCLLYYVLRLLERTKPWQSALFWKVGIKSVLAGNSEWVQTSWKLELNIWFLMDNSAMLLGLSCVVAGRQPSWVLDMRILRCPDLCFFCCTTFGILLLLRSITAQFLLFFAPLARNENVNWVQTQKYFNYRNIF